MMCLDTRHSTLGFRMAGGKKGMKDTEVVSVAGAVLVSLHFGHQLQ